MIGTWINVATVVVGTAAGRLLGGRLRPQTQHTVTDALGCVTLLLGMQNGLARPAVVSGGSLNAQLGFFLCVLLGILVGALIGEAVDIEKRLADLGHWAEARFKATDGDFGRGFVISSLVFCVGPLTVLGSFQDGLNGDFSMLATKSVLDFFSSMAFAAAFGWGVLLSAITVVVVQGSLTLGAGFFQHIMTDVVTGAMTSAGGIILIGMGFRLLNVKQVRAANLLPALVLAPLFAAFLGSLVPGLFGGS